MIQCIIIWRNTQNGAVGVITNEEGVDPAVFNSRHEAEEWAFGSPLLRAFPYKIVEVDDL